MANVGYATLQIIPSTAGFQKKLSGQVAASSAITGREAGKSMGAGIAGGAAASSGLISKGISTGTKGGLAGLAALAYGTLNASGDFEKAMNQVRAVSGATGDDFDALRDQAKDLGSSTRFSATQAASGMDFLARAGFKTKDILGALPDTLNLAAAANLDLGQAADITSNILTGYGLKTRQLGRANDVLVKAFTSSNTDLTQLGEAFKYVGPIAKGAGVEFTETAAAIGLMGNAGIQGSMAGTGLRTAITRLLNPVGAAKTAIDELGLKTTDSEGNLLSLTNIVGQLESKGATTAQIMELFGQRAGPAMSALVDQGSGALRNFQQTLTESGGEADRVAKTQMEGLSGVTTEMKSAFEGLFITLGDKGPLQAATALIGGITSGVQSLTGALEGGSSAGGAFGDTIDTIVAFAAPLIETVKDLGGQAMDVLGPAFASISAIVKNDLLPAFQAFLPAVQPVANFLLKIFGAALIGALSGVVTVVKGVLKVLAGVFNVFAGLLTGDWSKLWTGIKQIVSGVFTAIKGAVQVLWNVGILGVFKKAGTFLLKGLWVKLWSGIKSVALGAFNGLKGLVSKGWAALKSLFSKGVSAVWNFIRSGFSRIVSTVGSAMSTARSRVSSAWSSIRGFIANAVSAILGKIRSGFTSVVSTVRSKIEEVVGFVRGLPGKALSALGDVGSKLVQAGRDLIQGFINGIKEKAGGIVGSVTGPIKDAVGGVKGLLGINSPSRVFMEIGGNVADGMAIGVQKGAKRVTAATAALAETPDVGVSGAGALAGGGSASARARAVIENLTLQGSGNVHDDLEEVFFQVRHFERGGR